MNAFQGLALQLIPGVRTRLVLRIVRLVFRRVIFQIRWVDLQLLPAHRRRRSDAQNVDHEVRRGSADVHLLSLPHTFRHVLRALHGCIL